MGSSPLSERAGPLWIWARTGLGPLASDHGRDEEGARAFHAFNIQSGRRALVSLSVALIGFNLIFWATDSWAFHALSGVTGPISSARAVLTGIGVATLLAARAFPAQVRITGTVAGALTCVVLGDVFGRLGGPSTPWFHFVYPFLLGGLIGWGRPAIRIGGTALLAASLLAGYFGLHPEHLRDPFCRVALAHFGYVAALSILVGLFFDLDRARVFFLGRRLAAHATDLEARVALQTADIRALLQHQERVREQERAHLAREIHDELGQELTALRLALGAARAKAARLGSPLAPNLDHIASLLAGTTRTTRALMTDLRPRILDDLGFGPAAEWLVQRAAERAGFEATISLPTDLDGLDPDVAVVAFRVLQEALTNVVRHAAAARVSVTVSVVGGWMDLTVEDDGEGFDASPRAPKRAGMGLLGMTERARAAGGALSVHAAPGRGATIALRLPLGRPQEMVG